MEETLANDTRIETLANEVDRLRTNRHAADNHLQSLMLKVTEIQLNLATQDKTLGKLDAAVNGNGNLGLVTRIDRVERLASGLLKTMWLLTAASCTAVVKLMLDKFR
jgi:hypothetical protein